MVELVGRKKLLQLMMLQLLEIEWVAVEVFVDGNALESV